MDLYGTEYSFRSIMHYGSKVSLYRLTNQSVPGILYEGRGRLRIVYQEKTDWSI